MHIWEKKFSRKPLGQLKRTEHGELGPTGNYRHSKDHDTITDIKARKIEWLWHVNSMKTIGISEVIVDLKLDSKK